MHVEGFESIFNVLLIVLMVMNGLGIVVIYSAKNASAIRERESKRDVLHDMCTLSFQILSKCRNELMGECDSVISDKS